MKMKSLSSRIHSSSIDSSFMPEITVFLSNVVSLLGMKEQNDDEEVKSHYGVMKIEKEKKDFLLLQHSRTRTLHSVQK